MEQDDANGKRLKPKGTNDLVWCLSNYASSNSPAGSRTFRIGNDRHNCRE